jgi:hypothetical protein
MIYDFINAIFTGVLSNIISEIIKNYQRKLAKLKLSIEFNFIFKIGFILK